MKMSTRLSVSLALAGLAASASVLAQTAAGQQTVTVQGVAPQGHKVAPAWDQGRVYKFRDLVNYDGWVFRAQSGSAHKRPNVNDDDGWEKLNACDDLAEGSVLCEVANQAKTLDTEKAAQQEYNRVKQDMQKGKPANAPEG